MVGEVRGSSSGGGGEASVAEGLLLFFNISFFFLPHMSTQYCMYSVISFEGVLRGRKSEKGTGLGIGSIFLFREMGGRGTGTRWVVTFVASKPLG